MSLLCVFLGSCGHSRAPLYYIHSIKAGEGAIVGCGCGSWRDYLATCKKKCKGTANFGEFTSHTYESNQYRFNRL